MEPWCISWDNTGTQLTAAYLLATLLRHVSNRLQINDITAQHLWVVLDKTECFIHHHKYQQFWGIFESVLVYLLLRKVCYELYDHYSMPITELNWSRNHESEIIILWWHQVFTLVSRQPCLLCKKANQSKYFHPRAWKDDSLLECLKQFEPSFSIQRDSCICRSCNNEVKYITNVQFIPRWRKAKKDLPECTQHAHKVTKLVNKQTLSHLFYFKLNMKD